MAYSPGCSHSGSSRSGAGDAMFQAGVRAAYLASQLAPPGMVTQHSGLIVNISFWAAQKHVGNVAYGVAKAATDKLTADTAHELRDHNVAVVSLYPGLVRTEKVMEAAAWLDLSNSESPEFVGRAVADWLPMKTSCNGRARSGLRPLWPGSMVSQMWTERRLRRSR
jgi:NAD(P)-dependent dehydrogenase (short-subunit alcohol dehydrogenase family)